MWHFGWMALMEMYAFILVTIYAPLKKGELAPYFVQRYFCKGDGSVEKF